MSVLKSATTEVGVEKGYVFRHTGWAVMTLPFLGVAILAEASLFLPPGPVSSFDAFLSLILLSLTGMALLLPWRNWPVQVVVVVPLIYLSSCAVLIRAAGGSTSGVGLAVFLPILWAALYLEKWMTSVVLATVVVIELATTHTSGFSFEVAGLRRSVIYLAVGLLVAFTIHALRDRVEASNERIQTINAEMAVTIDELRERNRSASILSELVDMLDVCVTTDEAYKVIGSSANQLLRSAGSVMFLNNSRDRLEYRCAWGEHEPLDQSYSPLDCWALRRGQSYESRVGSQRCEHLRSSGITNTLCRPLLAQGEIIGVLTVGIPATSDPSMPTAYIEFFADHVEEFGDQISVWMANFQLREKLRDQAIRDPLTNLYNRRFMTETLNRELSMATRNNEYLSVIQMDVDHFKAINDTYGHEVGDIFLIAIARVMSDLFRISDVPCRSGGEEFTVLLPRCSGDVAIARSEELQARVSEIMIRMPDNQPSPPAPTLSIGIATSPEHGDGGEILLRVADKALYAAKTAGRNTIIQGVAVDSVGRDDSPM